MKPSERCDAEVRCGQADDTGEIPKHNADRILGPAGILQIVVVAALVIANVI